MKKEDLIKLGITDNEVIRKIQELNGLDREKERKKALNANDCGKTREAVKNMVSLLREEKSLRRVLNTASSCYYHETSKKSTLDTLQKQTSEEVELSNALESSKKNEVSETIEAPGEIEVTEDIENKDNI